MKPDVSALILAGGKATRFGGIAKHLLVVDGETIFARQVRVLAPRVAEILVSSTEDIAGYRTVRDSVAGAGPLAGIAAGLAAAKTPWLLVVAGDMPYLDGDMIDHMIALAPFDPDAIGVRVGDLPEPLLCLLHTRVLPTVEHRLASRRFKASGLFTHESLRVRWLTCDADPRSFRNVNSPEDL
jgi:molybdopterin-guanine dinucleotide biosynthesis protein A